VQNLNENGSGVVPEQFVLELHIMTEQNTVGDERIVALVRRRGYFGSGGIVAYVQHRVKRYAHGAGFVSFLNFYGGMEIPFKLLWLYPSSRRLEVMLLSQLLGRASTPQA
jgi:hypothetical protein